MITKSIATTLKHGQTLYHVKLKNADGTPMRIRVSGACKTWKTRPDEFQFPFKHGLYRNGHITGGFNNDEWCTTEPGTMIEG